MNSQPSISPPRTGDDPAGILTWPGGAPYALCLTHDVDRVAKHPYHYLLALRKGFRKGFLRQAATLKETLSGRSSFWNFPRIMGQETELGVRSTFLFLARRVSSSGLFHPWGEYTVTHPRLKALLRRLADGGWEIGLHGSPESSDDPDALIEEKNLLEAAAGVPVRSIRQHGLRLLPGRTWRLQTAAGFLADSTAGYADRYRDGLPEGGRRKIFPYYPEGSGVLELPMTLLDSLGFSRPGARANLEQLLEDIRGRGGMIVLDWHQETFHPAEHPARVEFYLETIRRAREDGAWIATMGETAEWWESRSAPPAARPKPGKP